MKFAIDDDLRDRNGKAIEGKIEIVAGLSGHDRAATLVLRAGLENS